MQRRKPTLTSALCIHVTVQTRHLVELYAEKNRTSLGEAGRSLLEAGAKALGIAEVP